MIDNELRLAAERTAKRYTHPEYRRSVASDDALELASAWLAEHPAGMEHSRDYEIGFADGFAKAVRDAMEEK